MGYSIDRGPHTTTTVQPTILPPAPSGVASLQGGLNLISNQAVAYRQHTYTQLKLTLHDRHKHLSIKQHNKRKAMLIKNNNHTPQIAGR